MKDRGNWWRGLLQPWLWRYGAPALLCAVALLQQYQVHARGLSPWKGGGFGMFSTVDSPSARFLRITLVTDSREVAVAVPGHLGAFAQRLRTLPDPAAARTFARSLAKLQWVGPELGSVRVTAQSRAQLTQPSPEEAPRLTGDDLHIGDTSPDLEPDLKLEPVIIGLAPGKAVPEGLAALNVRAIRLELWRYHLEDPTVAGLPRSELKQLSLQAEPFLQLEEPLPELRP